MTKKTYEDVKNDAGLLREYIVERHSCYLLNGGSVDRARRVNALVERLAKLSGLPVDMVWEDLIEDAELHG